MISGRLGNRSTHASAGPTARGASERARAGPGGSGRKASHFPEGAGLMEKALDSKLLLGA